MAEEKARLVTPAELAEAMNVSRGQVYKLAAAQDIPCIRIGTSIRFDPRDIRDYVKKCKSGHKEKSGPPLAYIPPKKKREGSR